MVAVFLSGRPLWVNRELNAADAFVAAWLPGTEGGGVADVLFKTATGKVASRLHRQAAVFVAEDRRPGADERRAGELQPAVSVRLRRWTTGPPASWARFPKSPG